MLRPELSTLMPCINYCTCDVLGTTCAASGPLGLASGKLPSAHAHRDAGEHNAVLLHIAWLDESWTGTTARARAASRAAGNGNQSRTNPCFLRIAQCNTSCDWMALVIFICVRHLAGISVRRSWTVKQTGRDLCRQVWLFFFLVFNVYLAFLAIWLNSFDFPVSQISNFISLDSNGIFRELNGWLKVSGHSHFQFATPPTASRRFNFYRYTIRIIFV